MKFSWRGNMETMLPQIVFTILIGFAAPAFAHGINGHVWVSDEGLKHLPPCEADLIAAFADPVIREKFQFGAAFPDSGYATSDAAREYGETAHWEPFIQAYIEYLRAKYDEDYSTVEAMFEVAFLMGVAQHGMEDEVFDSIFMRKSEEMDGIGQEALDPGTDFILVGDNITELTPEIYYPDDITAVYATMGIVVNERWIDNGTQLVRRGVIGLVDETPEGLAEEYRDDITWAAEHFLDPETPGGHAFEQTLVAPYVASIWHRLHGQLLTSDLIIGQVPPLGTRLLANEINTVDSWVTIFMGIGLQTRTLNADTVKVVDAIGEPVPVEVGWVIWSGSDSTTRLIQVRPVTDWTSDAEYTVTLSPSIERQDGETLGMALTVTFQTACESGAGCAVLPALEKTIAKCFEPVVAAKASGCSVSPSQNSNSRRAAVLPVLIGFLTYVSWRRREQFDL